MQDASGLDILFTGLECRLPVGGTSSMSIGCSVLVDVISIQAI